MTKLTCCVYLTKRDAEEIVYPKTGDLMILEFMLNNEKHDVVEKFGYVRNAYRRRITKHDANNGYRFHKNNNITPDYSITITLHVKVMEHPIKKERPCRLKFVSYISPCLRLFKSVVQIRNSVLCDFILRPTIENYKIPKIADTRFAVLDRLDPEQLQTVKEACYICTRPECGIYLIQGPPGTGKSHVILNIVRQLLFGEKKVKNCILICAPSNGAVDEITLRLLDLRSKLDSELFIINRFGIFVVFNKALNDMFVNIFFIFLSIDPNFQSELLFLKMYLVT